MAEASQEKASPTSPSPKKAGVPKWFWGAIAGLIAVIAVLIGVVFYLNRQVAVQRVYTPPPPPLRSTRLQAGTVKGVQSAPHQVQTPSLPATR